MNKYPLWKYLLILVVVVIAFVYALPNIYGENPAVQISPSRGAKVDQSLLTFLEGQLKLANLAYTGAVLEDNSAKIRFKDTETQLQARDLIQAKLFGKDSRENYTVALNLEPATPRWLSALGAKPMHLGLDLRGGVYFLMRVDTAAVLKKAEESYTDDMRRVMREKDVRYLTVTRLARGGIEIRFRDAQERDKGRDVIRKEMPDLDLIDVDRGSDFILRASLKPAAIAEKSRYALEQNMNSLRNRVNELGVTEPIIQQQGVDRIVVQLPGVQDTARAKEILGATATLEFRMVDEKHNAAEAA